MRKRSSIKVYSGNQSPNQSSSDSDKVPVHEVDESDESESI